MLGIETAKIELQDYKMLQHQPVPGVQMLASSNRVSTLPWYSTTLYTIISGALHLPDKQ